ncbi:MAG: hypothetical protein IT204_14865 [Fimbriimonadaceae bacterium]|nr:hypothetical protein [Fimbriimonadaceae bacterium]
MRIRMLGLLALLAATTATTAFADSKTLVQIEARDRSIREVVTILAKAANVTVTLRPEVRGLVTVSIKRMPFEQALTLVTAAQGFGWRKVGSGYQVGRFAAGPIDTAPTTALIATGALDPRGLARAFGWLDLSVLAEAAPVLDLRALLPPGLEGPPRPVEGGLEARGTAQAVGDLRFFVEQLATGRVKLRLHLLLAKITPEALAGLPVYWAQGAARRGSSVGREVQYACADFTTLRQTLAAQPAGVTLLGQQTVDLPGLGAVQVALGEQRVQLAARSEAAQSVQLWLRASLAVDGTTVPLELEGALLPPEEGCVLVSLPPAGATPGAVLLLALPEVVE